MFTSKLFIPEDSQNMVVKLDTLFASFASNPSSVLLKT